MSESKWENNSIQFPRMLAELRAVGPTEEQYLHLQDSMDLERGNIDEIFERAEVIWNELKSPDNLPSSDFVKEWMNGWEGGEVSVEVLSQNKPSMPEAVKDALEHVREHFPYVTTVFFFADGTWLYTGDTERTPNFDNKIDYSILRKASDAAYEDNGFPSAYRLDVPIEA